MRRREKERRTMIEFNGIQEELILTCDWCGAEVEELYELEGDQVCEQCCFARFEEKATEHMETNKVDAETIYQDEDEQAEIEADEWLAESWRDDE